MAHIIICKFGDHLPGILAGWCRWKTSTLSGLRWSGRSCFDAFAGASRDAT
jgi:hypothetical protein